MPHRSIPIACVLLILAAGAPGQERPATYIPGDPGGTAVLPPELPWTGNSRELALPPDAEWSAPCERTGFTGTPTYQETVAWLRTLADASANVSLVAIGRTAANHEIVMAVVSADGALTAEAAAASPKPLVLIQGGIHAGEIDGKDAGMMLLRDLTVRGNLAGLLDGVNVLFVPVLNVDGHERMSSHGRINQRGPEQVGWRTNSRNLNLNRDYTRLETPEVRAIVAAIHAWDPDLYIDIHVTDGVDYQYDITWGYNGPHTYSPNAVAWLDSFFTPAVRAELEAQGHVPGPLVFAVDGNDLLRGIKTLTLEPRYSSGWGDAAHVPTVLVETHSLKSFERRVLGTYVFLESALRAVVRNGRQLQGAVSADRKSRRRALPLDWGVPAGDTAYVEMAGVGYKRRPSDVSGALRIDWTGEPVTYTIPNPAWTRPLNTVDMPDAYWIPAAWTDVIEVLERQGVQLDRIESAEDVEVTLYRMGEPNFGTAPYEGHIRVSAKASPEVHTVTYPAGSARVPTDQRFGVLAALLLEPLAPDSFFRWGYFHSILQRTEYAADYVLEPMASRLLAEDHELARDFIARLGGDPEFAASSRQRLDWFYERTRFFDRHYRLYPVGREE